MRVFKWTCLTVILIILCKFLAFMERGYYAIGEEFVCIAFMVLLRTIDFIRIKRNIKRYFVPYCRRILLLIAVKKHRIK